jgi:NTP pyrophosphatase (non-canonical NTP hydrolase)
LPLGGFYDIEDSLHFARKGGTLTMSQLLRIYHNLHLARQVVLFLKADLPPLPIIQSIREVIAVHKKLEEEIGERRMAMESGKDVNAPHGLREELGDTLFMTAKIAQMSGIDPEDALHRACDKFDARFREVEESAGKPLAEYSEEELLALWRAAKEKLS